MADVGIPEHVQELLREHIHTYEQLETLVLLFKEPAGVWTVDTFSERLKIPDTLAEEALQQLVASGLAAVKAAQGGRSIYELNRPDAEAIVAEVARVHEHSRMELIHLLSVNAIRRMRTQAARMFADAFVIRRKKKDG